MGNKHQLNNFFVTSLNRYVDNDKKAIFERKKTTNV